MAASVQHSPLTTQRDSVATPAPRAAHNKGSGKDSHHTDTVPGPGFTAIVPRQRKRPRHKGRDTVTSEPDMVIAGYAVLFGDLLDTDVLAELSQLGHSPDNLFAALFIYDTRPDGHRTKWTLFGTDVGYAQMLATQGDRIELPTTLLRERFPAYQPGWVIDTDTHG